MTPGAQKVILGLVAAAILGAIWFYKGRGFRHGENTVTLYFTKAEEGALTIPLSAGCLEKGINQGKVVLSVSAVPVVCTSEKCGVYEARVPLSRESKGNLGGLTLDSSQIQRAVGSDLGN